MNVYEPAVFESPRAAALFAPYWKLKARMHRVSVMTVNRMFCALTDNGTDRPLCGLGGTELSVCVCQEIPGIRRLLGTTSAGT